MDIRGLKAMFGCGVVCWGTKADSDGFVVRGSLDDFAGFLCRRDCRVDDENGYRVSCFKKGGSLTRVQTR